MRLENLDICSGSRREQLIKEAGAIVFFDERLLVDTDLQSLAEYCSRFNQRSADVVNDPVLYTLPVVSQLKRILPFEHQIRRWIELPYVPNIQIRYKQMVENLVQQNKKVYYYSDTFLEQAQVVARAAGIPVANVRAHEIIYRRSGIFRSFTRQTVHDCHNRIEHLKDLGLELGCDTVAYFAADLTRRPIRSEEDGPTDDEGEGERRKWLTRELGDTTRYYYFGEGKLTHSEIEEVMNRNKVSDVADLSELSELLD